MHSTSTPEWLSVRGAKGAGPLSRVIREGRILHITNLLTRDSVCADVVTALSH